MMDDIDEIIENEAKEYFVERAADRVENFSLVEVLKFEDLIVDVNNGNLESIRGMIEMYIDDDFTIIRDDFPFLKLEEILLETNHMIAARVIKAKEEKQEKDV